MKLSIRSLSLGLVVLLSFFGASPPPIDAATAAGPHGFEDGSYRGRILTERFRRQQRAERRKQQGIAALSVDPARQVRDDIGNIAIIDDSGGVVVQPNVFDLGNTTLLLTRNGAGYRVDASDLDFNEEARQNGTVVPLGDDDSREVFLPFSFPFFGQNYNRLFINSDGNLTFGEPDMSSSARSLSRAASGPPRIAPLFTDLDPSQTGGGVITLSEAGRLFITWDNVPEFSLFGNGRRQTFQVVLHANGDIEFHFSSITLNDSVVGIMPGQLQGELSAVDLSAGLADPASAGLAEIFSSMRSLDIFAVAQRFYQNHDDAYDFLVLFNGLGLPVSGSAFAFEVNVRNEVRGIGDIIIGMPVFDFGSEFGSLRRLQSFMNMGPLSSYPDDPEARIPVIGENNTLSVLTHEAGHRFLAYPAFIDSTTGSASLDLLGRDLSHWSFFFNSDASVLEGNRIEDRGMMTPRFETTGTVEHYSSLDQYLMGLRGEEEVLPTFVVDSPRNFQPSLKFRGSSPQTGVTFDGTRQEITLDTIIEAEGPRIPDSSVSQKDFNFAFVLLVPEGAEPSSADVSKLEEFRTRWQEFFGIAADGRATANTELVRMLHLSTWPAAGLVRGMAGRGTVEIASPLNTSLDVLLETDNGAISTPPVVTLPAGESKASFPLMANSSGLSSLSAEAASPGFDIARTLVEVKENLSPLQMTIVSGDGQVSAFGATLPEPIVLQVRDSNLLPYSGIPVVLTPSRDGEVTPEQTTTDARGQVTVEWRLASTGSLNTLQAEVEGVPQSAVEVTAGAAGPHPVFEAAGVVNAASFNQGLSAANDALTPGGLVSIFGTGLALNSLAAGEFPLPTSLGSTRVTVNGIASSLLFVSPEQINLQVPFEVIGTTAQLTVFTPAGSAGPVTLALAAAQPGIFQNFESGLGAVVNADDGTPVWLRPARAGTFVGVFCTGLGMVEPPVRTGLPAPLSPLSQTLTLPEVLVDGQQAEVTFSGLAPFFAGLYQLNVLLPADLPPGRHSLVVAVEGRSSNEVLIEVE